MKRTADLPRSLVVLLLGFGLLVLALPLIFWYRLDYYEVCPQCARKRDVQEWLVPFTQLAYYRYQEIQETPLSSVLLSLDYQEHTAHHWLVVHGNGPGSRSIFGEGYPVAHGLITPPMGRFVELLHQHTDEREVAYWFARMTHPQHAYVVRNVADQCVSQAHADAQTFQTRLREVAAHELRLHTYRLGRVDEPEIRTPPRLLYQRSPR